MSRSNADKVYLCTAYFADISKISAHSTDPGTTGVNELSGGSPAYARVAPGTPTFNGSGLGTIVCVVNVPAGATVGGIGAWDASGVFLDGGPVTSTAFASQGTYTVTYTYQQN